MNFKNFWEKLLKPDEWMGDKLASHGNFAKAEHFQNFTFSKHSHFEFFQSAALDVELFGSEVDPGDCNLKVYQDLLAYAILKNTGSNGARILDIGGGDSRILKKFKDRFECWNIDKLEGIGNGPTEVDPEGYRLVTAYMGDFCEELPNGYFDYVFSISSLEHVDEKDSELHGAILRDINRVLKPNGLSFHLFDCVTLGDYTWANPMLSYLFENTTSLNDFIEFAEVRSDPDTYVMSERYYEKSWQHTTKKSYEEFGSPFSYNIFWRNLV